MTNSPIENRRTFVPDISDSFFSLSMRKTTRSNYSKFIGSSISKTTTTTTPSATKQNKNQQQQQQHQQQPHYIFLSGIDLHMFSIHFRLNDVLVGITLKCYEKECYHYFETELRLCQCEIGLTLTQTKLSS